MSASDRIPLLRSILASPKDDLPRLVYADYLEEFGSGDLDAATVEFIRAGCNSSGKKLMPRGAYKWLHDNWKRLVPNFVQRNDCMVLGMSVTWRGSSKGRTVKTSVVVPYDIGRRGATGVNHFYSIRLRFSRGFLDDVIMWSERAAAAVAHHLRADQPLCRFPGYGWFKSALLNRYAPVHENPLDDLKIFEPAQRPCDTDTVTT